MFIVERLFSQRVARSAPIKALALAISLSVSFGAVANSQSLQSYQPVEPTIDQARANILIARQLQFTHFRDLRVSDELSGEIFDTYLKYLDGQKVYLTQDDLDGFANIR
ncbi:MAG TPA: tail-specific protease, partial [Marinobacter sp.]|nr:tail-specific protease [Marinobacter sp.]